VVFASGLSEDQVKEVEEHHGFKFPPDLRKFLLFAVPVSQGWPDWRDVTIGAMLLTQKSNG
jgi:hypothetical protein